ncbi:MAG TPA: nascent polypeptide-associated complex protein [Candidatus Nanoarchaeia archaeon]|nr:nascent polypeptide-associated complex protein [Candidatus Nanoarchaeia archaeon]
MFPGVDERAMKAAMRKLGVQQQQVDAEEVVIKLRGGSREIVVANPSVAKVTMMGQETFQITGEYSERASQPLQLFNDDDVNTVVEQTQVSEAEAREALSKAGGDIAAAILFLNENQG